MKIKTIEFEFGMTQNLGNYTNVKPVARVMAELAETDNPVDVFLALQHSVQSRIHELVDDELERAGEQVRYSDEPLYQVRYSNLRQCVVIFPDGFKLPEERTWKETDSWNYGNGNYPRRMRLETAKEAIKPYATGGYETVILLSTAENLILPPLPNPGPEPLWHKKQLRSHLQRLNINESDWEELAALDHVNDNFLYQVNEWRNDWKNRHSANQTMILNIIRTGVFPDTQPTPTPDGDSSYPRGDEGLDDGEDYEEEDEDTDE